MKKILLMAGVMSSVYAVSAQAQNYNSYDNGYYNYQAPEVESNYTYQAPEAESYNYQAPANNYSYQAPIAKSKADFKNFSIGMDFVVGSTSTTDYSFELDNPLLGGNPYRGKMDDFEDSLNSLNGNIGWRPYRYFGLEAFYQQSLSDNVTKYQEHYAGSDTFAQAEYSVEYKAYGIDALFYWPILSRLELIASAGYAIYDFSAEAKFNAYDGSSADLVRSNVANMDEDTGAFRAGLGAQIKLTEKLYARGMYRYSSIGGDYFDDISEISLGVRYNF